MKQLFQPKFKLKVMGVLLLVFINTGSLFSQNMTFDTSPTHTGFTLTRWHWIPQYLFPSNALITKNNNSCDVISFQTRPFSNVNSTRQAYYIHGNTYNFIPNNGNPAWTIHALTGFIGTSFLKIKRIDAGSNGGNNRSFDFGNIVYVENNAPASNMNVDGLSFLPPTSITHTCF